MLDACHMEPNQESVVMAASGTSLEVEKIAEALRSTYKDNLGKIFGTATNKALVAEEVFSCQLGGDERPEIN